MQLFDVGDIVQDINDKFRFHYLILAIGENLRYTTIELETGWQSTISFTWMHNACQKVA